MLDDLAQKIATYTSEIVGYEVIVTNDKAIIIGASDKAKIGEYDKIASQVIVLSNSLSFGDKKNGITLPIEYANRLVGAIRIIGDYERVEKFGIMAKTYAELMLQEKMHLKSNIMMENAVKTLVKEISVFNPVKNEEGFLITRGYELGYDLKPPHMAILVDIINFSKLTRDLYDKVPKCESTELHIQSIKYNVLSIIKSTFNNPNDVITPMLDDKFIILHTLNYNFHEKSALEKIKIKCAKIISELKRKGYMATIGIGAPAKNMHELSKSYNGAWKSVELGKKFKSDSLIFYSKELFVEDLIASINRDTAKRYIQQTISGLQIQPDWPELSRTIRAWCESGFNLKKASETLYIHRNTLNYRLDKICEISEVNIRNYKDAVMLYLAVLMIDLGMQ